MNNMKKLEIKNNLLIVTDEEYPTAIIPLDDVVKLATIYDETKKAYLIEYIFTMSKKWMVLHVSQPLCLMERCYMF